MVHREHGLIYGLADQHLLRIMQKLQYRQRILIKLHLPLDFQAPLQQALELVLLQRYLQQTIAELLD